MHSYSTDNDNRPIVLAALGICSFILSSWISPLLASNGKLGMLASFAPVSWTGIFGILFLLVNYWGWKLEILRKLKIVDTPNFSGTWKGYIATSHDIPDSKSSDEYSLEGDMTPIDAELTIKQSWWRIGVSLNPETNSKSDSKGATVLTEDGLWPSLNYQYRNEPEPESEDGMEMHYGTGNLELREENGQKILEGVYYTGPGRKNHGKMYFKLKSSG